jgi:hypothetical protein
VENRERLALEKREKAEAERRQREDSLRVEAERRRSENERINRERRERIEAAERERRESLEAARREREATLARARAQRDTVPLSGAAPAIEPAPTAPAPKPTAPEKTAQVVATAPTGLATPAAPNPPSVVGAAPTTAGAAPKSAAFKDLVTSAQIRAILSRALRAAMLDRKVYEEVEADRGASVQAAIVVGAGAIASAIGALPLLAARGPLAIPGEVAAGLLSWAAYAYAAYVVGTTAFRGRETKADWGEVARTLGFASAPRVLLALGPGFAGFVWLWILATTVVAIRAALDVTTWRAVLIAFAAWLALGFVQALATGVARGLAPGT